MGDMADYDMYENINNVGKLESTVYSCGVCGKKFRTDRNKCQQHVNKCTGDKNDNTQRI